MEDWDRMVSALYRETDEGLMPDFDPKLVETLAGVDTVVLATGPKANDGLYFALKGEVENLHRIGDCVAPRKLDHAIYEGHLAGRELWSPEQRYIYEGDLERDEAVPIGA